MLAVARKICISRYLIIQKRTQCPQINGIVITLSSVFGDALGNLILFVTEHIQRAYIEAFSAPSNWQCLTRPFARTENCKRNFSKALVLLYPQRSMHLTYCRRILHTTRRSLGCRRFAWGRRIRARYLFFAINPTRGKTLRTGIGSNLFFCLCLALKGLRKRTGRLAHLLLIEWIECVE